MEKAFDWFYQQNDTKNYQVGDCVQAGRTAKTRFPGIITEIQKVRVKVHYLGQSERWDEYLYGDNVEKIPKVSLIPTYRRVDFAKAKLIHFKIDYLIDLYIQANMNFLSKSMSPELLNLEFYTKTLGASHIEKIDEEMPENCQAMTRFEFVKLQELCTTLWIVSQFDHQEFKRNQVFSHCRLSILKFLGYPENHEKIKKTYMALAGLYAQLGQHETSKYYRSLSLSPIKRRYEELTWKALEKKDFNEAAAIQIKKFHDSEDPLSETDSIGTLNMICLYLVKLKRYNLAKEYAEKTIDALFIHQGDMTHLYGIRDRETRTNRFLAMKDWAMELYPDNQELKLMTLEAIERVKYSIADFPQPMLASIPHLCLTISKCFECMGDEVGCLFYANLAQKSITDLLLGKSRSIRLTDSMVISCFNVHQNLFDYLIEKYIRKEEFEVALFNHDDSLSFGVRYSLFHHFDKSSSSTSSSSSSKSSSTLEEVKIDINDPLQLERKKIESELSNRKEMYGSYFQENNFFNQITKLEIEDLVFKTKKAFVVYKLMSDLKVVYIWVIRPKKRYMKDQIFQKEEEEEGEDENEDDDMGKIEIHFKEVRPHLYEEILCEDMFLTKEEQVKKVAMDQTPITVRADISKMKVKYLTSLGRLELYYKTFIDPIEEYIDDFRANDGSNWGNGIVIIQDPHMNHLSFASFRSEKHKEFLIKRYNFSFALSFRMALIGLSLKVRHQARVSQMRQGNEAGQGMGGLMKGGKDGPLSILLVGDPIFMDKNKQLPGTFRELKSIYNTIVSEIPESSNCSKILIQEEATKENVEAILSDVSHRTRRHLDIIHFATHSIVENELLRVHSEFDLRGKILLTDKIIIPDEQKSSEEEEKEEILIKDSFLTAKEITQKFSLEGTDLVVLSCCESAKGRNIRSGVLGLYRAFFLSLVSSVIASKKNVSDQVATFVMKRFYENLIVNRMSKSESLRLSILDTVDHLKLQKTPDLWDSFVLLGVDGKLDLPEKISQENEINEEEKEEDEDEEDYQKISVFLFGCGEGSNEMKRILYGENQETQNVQINRWMEETEDNEAVTNLFEEFCGELDEKKSSSDNISTRNDMCYIYFGCKEFKFSEEEEDWQLDFCDDDDDNEEEEEGEDEDEKELLGVEGTLLQYLEEFDEHNLMKIVIIGLQNDVKEEEFEKLKEVVLGSGRKNLIWIMGQKMKIRDLFSSVFGEEEKQKRNWDEKLLMKSHDFGCVSLSL